MSVFSKVTVLREIPGPNPLRRQWNRLLEISDRREIFYTYEWASAIANSFPHRVEPFLVLAYQQEDVVSLASLAVLKDDRERATFLAAFTADYCDFLGDPEFRTPFVHAAFSELARCGIAQVELGQIPGSSPTIAAIQRLPSPWHSRVRDGESCLLVEFPDAPSRASVAQEVNRKQAEKRHQKALEKSGPIRIDETVSSPDIDSELAGLIRAHIVRFFLTDRVSPFLEEGRVGFLHHLAKLTATAGWLKLSTLKWNDSAIAWNYGFDFSGKWFWYIPTFRVEFDSFGPGTLLLKHLLLAATSSPDASVLDLGLGDEFYKTRFATSSLPTKFIRLSTSVPSHYLGSLRDKGIAAIGQMPSLKTMLPRIRVLKSKLDQNGLRLPSLLARKILHAFRHQETLLFYRYQPDFSAERGEDYSLAKLTGDDIADCALLSANDASALNYLHSATKRLFSGSATGFVLKSGSGECLSFGWLSEVEGFHVEEIDVTLAGPGQVIFDCFTPERQRGKGYYPLLLKRLAAQIASERRAHLVIFCSAANSPSRKGIEKAGFEPEYEITRKKFLGRSSTNRRPISISHEP